jgi:uncharacterized membrane protein YcaP (DUF421 family)
VHLGIVESNGNISVLKKTNKTEVTMEDLNLTKSTATLSYPLIIDGIVYKDVLVHLNLSEDWLNQQLANIGVKSTKEIFYASVNTKQEFQASLNNSLNENMVLPPIYN